MSIFRLSGRLYVTLAAVCLSACAGPATISPGLGTSVMPSQLDGFDLVVEADGGGLPPGNGTAAAGMGVYQARCQACHGAGGEGVTAATVLVGGDLHAAGPPLRTVGSFWPHATTLFDFIRRAMPADSPKSLTDTEVYQVTAYLLYLNGLIDINTPLDRDRLPSIAMPNQGGFIDRSQIQ